MAGAGLSVAEAMTLATGLTAIRVAVDRERDASVGLTAGAVAKVVAAGAIVTIGMLVVERGAPELTRSFAVLVLITSALVNGVRLADIAISATK
jgi:hypothetical protein